MSLKSSIVGVLMAGLMWVACGAPDRENPNDPRGSRDGANVGIQLVANLPEGRTGGVSNVLAQIRYEVSGEDLRQLVEGRMDLVGRSARALVIGVIPGDNRIFRVTAMDPTAVVTFAGAVTIDVGVDTPETVELQLVRLSGSLELTSNLPPEITELEVHIDAQGDTLLRRYTIDGPLIERINDIPTGGDVGVVLRGYDAEGSKADLRFDPAIPSGLLDGWFQGQVVKYLLFEHPASTAVIDFGAGEINTPQMYTFFANNRDEKDGFEIDVEAQASHNVVTRLPGQEGYSPLWVLQVFKLAAFDRVQDLASALDQSKNEENKVTLEQLLYLNAPIVQVGEL